MKATRTGHSCHCCKQPVALCIQEFGCAMLPRTSHRAAARPATAPALLPQLNCAQTGPEPLLARCNTGSCCTSRSLDALRIVVVGHDDRVPQGRRVEVRRRMRMRIYNRGRHLTTVSISRLISPIVYFLSLLCFRNTLVSTMPG